MRRVLVVAMVGALLLAGCGDDDSDTETSGGAAAPTTAAAHDDAHDHGTTGGAHPCEPSGTALEIVASDIKFDKDCLAAPAGQLFTVTFRNNDSLPHSLAFVKAHQSNENLFRGAEVFTGPRTVTVNGPALEAGTYAFHCTVHPSVMKGTFVVG